MLESFKITAQKLKRILKVHISLPDDYNDNDNIYPLVIALDGQLLFNFINENTKKMEIQDVLDKLDRKCIFIALQAPKIEAWRMSELNPYYNGSDKTVDTILSYIFFDYIVVELLPFLNGRFRFKDEIYLLGFNEGGIAALNMVYRYDIFKGAGLFNPSFSECSTKLTSDLNKYFNPDKKIYIYHGEKESNENDNTLYYVSAELKKKAPDMITLDIDKNSNNDYDGYHDHLINFFNLMLKK